MTGPEPGGIVDVQTNADGDLVVDVRDDPDPTPHTVAWFIDSGGPAVPYFTCTAPAGAHCRTWCDSGCEERCTDPDEHPFVDQGECLMVAWLEAEGPGAEAYDGDKASVHDGPIVLRWETRDEMYLWSYPEPIE